jgi:hypothetical protein
MGIKSQSYTISHVVSEIRDYEKKKKGRGFSRCKENIHVTKLKGGHRGEKNLYSGHSCNLSGGPCYSACMV